MTRRGWDAYWASDVAAAVHEEGVPVVVRLFDGRDDLERARRRLRREGPVSVGSAGQPRLHPLVGYVDRLEGLVGRLEGELGLTPLARARLGISTADAQSRLQAFIVEASS